MSLTFLLFSMRFAHISDIDKLLVISQPVGCSMKWKFVDDTTIFEHVESVDKHEISRGQSLVDELTEKAKG